MSAEIALLDRVLGRLASATSDESFGAALATLLVPTLQVLTSQSAGLSLFRRWNLGARSLAHRFAHRETHEMRVIARRFDVSVFFSELSFVTTCARFSLASSQSRAARSSLC